jgi:hypothetical protein
MKIWAYLAIFVLVIGAAGAAAKSIHSAGYNKRDQEVQQDIIDAQIQAAADAEARWSASVVAATQAIRVEERIVEKIREVEIEIPKVVERIVELTPECADLGPAYAGMLNNQVRAGNGIQIASPTDAADAGLQSPD